MIDNQRFYQIYKAMFLQHLRITMSPVLLLLCLSISAQQIPLPEHPRPDFQRELWQNLNGSWAFAFDVADEGIEHGWRESIFHPVAG